MAEQKGGQGTPSSVTARSSEQTCVGVRVEDQDGEDMEAGGTVLPCRSQISALPIPLVEADRDRFCCGGLCYFGPEPGFLLCSLLLLLLPAVVFYQTALPRLPETLQVEIAWAVGLVLTATLGVLCTVAFSDPGIIPRDPCPTLIPPPGPSRVTFVLVNGVSVPRKWCTTCCIYRPPRTKHCSVCNNCVQRFDHHCPWISNCVGARNYRVFVVFVFCCAVYSLLVVTSATSALLRDIRDAGQPLSLSSFWEASKRCPQLAGLFVYSLCCCVPLINLFLFNVYLVLNNITTNEEVLQLFPERNPFSAASQKALECSSPKATPGASLLSLPHSHAALTPTAAPAVTAAGPDRLVTSVVSTCMNRLLGTLYNPPPHLRLFPMKPVEKLNQQRKRSTQSSMVQANGDAVLPHKPAATCLLLVFVFCFVLAVVSSILSLPAPGEQQ